MDKYVSIDIETTGIDPENNQIIEIGAIIEDVNNPLPFDEIPKFKRIIKHPVYTGDAFPINMNQRIFKELAKDSSEEEITYPGLVVFEFVDFLLANGFKIAENDKRIKIVAAGKNFSSFDRMFLQKLPKWGSRISTGHRALDPGMLYLDFEKDDDAPSLKLCKERAGVEGEVTHNALEDAWDVIRVLRPFYIKKEIANELKIVNNLGWIVMTEPNPDIMQPVAVLIRGSQKRYIYNEADMEKFLKENKQ